MHKGDLRIIQSLSKETPKDLPNDYLGSYIMLINVMHVSVNNCIYNMQILCKCNSFTFTCLNLLHLHNGSVNICQIHLYGPM